MEPHIVMAVMGALIGATIGQLKSKTITQDLPRYLRDRLQKLLASFDRSAVSDKTEN